MIKFTVIGAVIVLALAALAVSLDSPAPAVEPQVGIASVDSSESGQFAQRLEQLELTLERQLLENRELQRRIELLEQTLDLALQQELPAVTRAPALNDDRGGMAATDREAMATQRAVNSLLEAGFDEFRANDILAEVNRVRAEVLSALELQEERPDRDEVQLEVSNRLKLSLGEYDYEQFLNATGQPTRVPVREVQPESPAAIAGLQPGDEIVRYAGERVFNSTELIDKTSNSIEGSSVLVEVEREGIPYSFTVPAGSLGVTIDRRR